MYCSSCRSDIQSVRYWDGYAWVGEPALQPGVRAGESMQRSGCFIFGIGAGVTWIIVGVAALALIVLLITKVAT